jgi:hypothetical protein
MRHVPAVTLVLAVVAMSCGSHHQAIAASQTDATAASPSQPETLSAVPKQFLGRWASTSALCSDPSSDAGGMVVEPKQITFWEASGQVLSVASQGDLQVVIRLKYSDNNYDGDALKSITFDLTLRLSADRRTVTTVEGGKSRDVRHNCSSNG